MAPRLGQLCTQSFVIYLQSGAAGWGKGFVTCFLRVPEAAGLNCSCHAAQATNRNFQKTCYKTFNSTCRPRLYSPKLSWNELKRQKSHTLQVISGRQQIHLASLEKSFTFDYAYDHTASQEDVYSSSVKVRRIWTTMTRGIRNPGVRQCLGLCSADT